MNGLVIFLSLLVVAARAQVNLGGIQSEKEWTYITCGGMQSVQVDVNMGIGYVNSAKLTVLIDFKTKEAAFKFISSSRCLVAPLNTKIFGSTADDLEINAATLSFQHALGDSSKFAKFKVVRVSDNIDPDVHFNEDRKLDRVKSDLIVETCEDVKTLATASIQSIDDSDTDCTSLNQFDCILTSKICESPQ